MQSCSESFHCIEIFFIFQDFWGTCACPEKQCALNPLYWIYIFKYSEFWTTCPCPEKQSLPRNFSLHWNIFYLSGFLSNLCLPWKTECALKFSSRGGGAPPAPLPRTRLIITGIEHFVTALWVGQHNCSLTRNTSCNNNTTLQTLFEHSCSLTRNTCYNATSRSRVGQEKYGKN